MGTAFCCVRFCLYINQPMEEIYENIKGPEQVVNESGTVWPIESFEYGTFGIHTNVKGADFPQRGYAAPEAVWGINTAKRMIVESVKVLGRPEFLVTGLAFLVLPYSMKLKTIERAIQSFNRLADGVLSPYYIKEIYLTAQSKWVIRTVSTFFVEMGISQEASQKIAKIVGHICEYDNTYRLKLIDILSETSTEKLASDPKQEIKRLVGIIAKRDNYYLMEKVGTMTKIAFIMLMVPKIRRAFKKAVGGSEVEKAQVDNTDRYWMCHRQDGYKYFGLTDLQRKNLLVSSGYTVLEGVKIK